MLPAAAILLVFLAYPLALGFWLGLTDTPIGQPGRFVGLANFVSLAHDTVFWLVGLQHDPLHARRQRLQIRPWPLSGAAAQPPAAVQGHDPRRRAAAVRRADGALRDRVLVDLRSAILDYLLDADEDRLHRSFHRLPRRAVERALVGDRRQHLARHPLRRDHPARGPADDFALALRGGDARRRQRLAAVPPCHVSDAHADHRRRHDVLGADDLRRLPARSTRSPAAARSTPRISWRRSRSSGRSPAAISARARRSPTP